MKQRPTNISSRLMYNLIKRYRHSTIPRWVVLFIDMLLFFLAFIVVEAFSSHGFANLSLGHVSVDLVANAIVTLLFFLGVGTHRGIMRHLGMNDVYKIIVATVGPLAICWGLNLINNNVTPHIVESRYLLSYQESFMLYILLSGMMIVLRLAMQKIYNDYFKKRRPEVNIVIYGAGAAGIITSTP